MTDFARQVIDHDLIYPRDEDNRYRVYARVGDELTVLATSPDAGGVGQALVTLHDDQKQIGRRLADHGQIGVLDTLSGECGGLGEWVVLPWNRSGQ